jgi:hypothetical protein
LVIEQFPVPQVNEQFPVPQVNEQFPVPLKSATGLNPGDSDKLHQQRSGMLPDYPENLNFVWPSGR